MEAMPCWQFLVLPAIVCWLFISTSLSLTPKLRSLIQPWVTRRVHGDIPIILLIQRYQNGFLDTFFTGLSFIVSVPFYTAFLPLVFWSGHSKLGRQMTLLLAFCDYVGNSLKDLVSAPRPTSPAIRKIISTKDEKENALEYGLPSSHALNTVCLSGYMAYYALSDNNEAGVSFKLLVVLLVLVLVGLIGVGRIYLGMHSLIDVSGGVFLGVAILGLWLSVHGVLDAFIVSGHHVAAFWSGLAFLLLFAYPEPEYPTPSFEFHTSFNGVALGIVCGVQQTYHEFHHEGVPRIFTQHLGLMTFLERILVGLPTILFVKFCSKALAKWLLPILCTILGIPVKSSYYIPLLKTNCKTKSDGDNMPSSVGYFERFFWYFQPQHGCFDVDTGIRFLQYAGLAWSVVDLVPSLFSLLKL
ncbi:lipid phosphate phosphatase delta [Nymphaea colorata]|nr:lipid phosphate phosphatase delta [Nymphaea colorata]